jgi:hypothetical protein
MDEIWSARHEKPRRYRTDRYLARDDLGNRSSAKLVATPDRARKTFR